MKVLGTAACLAAAMMLAGCSTSEKVAVQQIDDDKLSCTDLKMEFVRLDAAQKDVESKKGATGTNVAAALFWLPGLAYTYYDAGQADQALRDRRSHLTGLYNKKRC